VFGIGPATQVYLAVGATDMRKGYNGLNGLVRDRLELNPTSGHLFLFCNGSRIPNVHPPCAKCPPLLLRQAAGVLLINLALVEPRIKA
jgi:transposase